MRRFPSMKRIRRAIQRQEIMRALVLLTLFGTIVSSQGEEIEKDPAEALKFAVSAPRPDYPYEARRDRKTGTGKVLLSVDVVTGGNKR